MVIRSSNAWLPWLDGHGSSGGGSGRLLLALLLCLVQQGLTTGSGRAGGTGVRRNWNSQGAALDCSTREEPRRTSYSTSLPETAANWNGIARADGWRCGRGSEQSDGSGGGVNSGESWSACVEDEDDE